MKYEQIIFHIQVHTSVNNVRDTMKNFGLLITLKKKIKSSLFWFVRLNQKQEGLVANKSPVGSILIF